MKLCKKCGTEKSLENFHKDKSRSDGLFPWCKDCVSVSSKAGYKKNKHVVDARNKKYATENAEKIKTSKRKNYETNKEEILNYNKQYREENKEKIKQKKKAYREANKESEIKRSRDHYFRNREKYVLMAKERYQGNKERHAECGKAWAGNNPEKRKKSVREYNRRFRSTPKGHISSTISKRMNESLQRGMKAGRHWESLVGYDVDQLKIHLEKQFDENMTWENYGSYWHIDHARPIASFNFNSPDDKEFKDCWALSNLRPLEAKENMSKGSRIAA